MASIFTKIINGEIPSHKIAEDDNFYAFLDISPVAVGHTLVIPKKEIDYIFDIDDDTYAGLMLFAKRVAKAIDKTISCERVGITVLGLEVPHAHVHLVPLNKAGIIDFAKKVSQTQDELKATAEKISANFE